MWPEPILSSSIFCTENRVCLSKLTSRLIIIKKLFLGCFAALDRFIEAARRCGKLDQVTPMLTHVDKLVTGCHRNPKFHFCRGLYEWSVYFWRSWLLFVSDHHMSQVLLIDIHLYYMFSGILENHQMQWGVSIKPGNITFILKTLFFSLFNHHDVRHSCDLKFMSKFFESSSKS